MGRMTFPVFLLFTTVLFETKGDFAIHAQDALPPSGTPLTGPSVPASQPKLATRNSVARRRSKLTRKRQQGGWYAPVVQDDENDCRHWNEPRLREIATVGDGGTKLTSAKRTPGGAQLRGLSQVPGVARQERQAQETFLLVSVDDEDSLRKVYEGAAAFLSLAGMTSNPGKERATRAAASDPSREATQQAAECLDAAVGPPVAVRFADRLKLTSFSLSNAMCLEGGAYAVTTIQEVRKVDNGLYIAPSTSSFIVQHFWIWRRWKERGWRSGARPRPQRLFVALQENILATRAKKPSAFQNNPQSREISERSHEEWWSTRTVGKGDRAVLICLAAGDPLIAVPAPFAALLSLEQPEKHADQSFTTIHGWRERADIRSDTDDSSNNETRHRQHGETVALVLEAHRMENILAYDEDTKRRDDELDWQGATPPTFFFAHAWRNNSKRGTEDVFRLFGHPWRQLRCFLDIMRPSEVVKEPPRTAYTSRGGDIVVLRCQPTAAHPDPPRNTAEMLEKADKVIRALLVASFLSIFLAPFATVAGHALADSSESIDRLWQVLDRGFTEYNPRICQTFNRLTSGAQEKWFDATRLSNIFRAAMYIPTDWRAGLGVLCGGLSFRVGLLAGASWRPLLVAFLAMRLTRWAYSLYQRISPNGSTGASSDLSESTSGSASPNLEGGNYDLSRTALSQTPSEVSQKKPRPASVAPDTNRGDKKNAERMHATGRESCRIPTAIYCVGLKTALQNEIVTGSSPHDSAEGHVAGVGLPNDSYLTSAGGAPAASYLLVAATSDAGENTAAYSREQGTVYVGRQPGTGHLALRHEERIQTAVDQHALGGAGESGWVTAQSELERSGRRRQSVGNLPKEAQRVVVPRRPLRVVGNGTGSGVCVDDSAFTVAVVENMTHFGETLNVKVPSSAVDFLLSNEAAVGDLPNQFQGEGSRATVLIPLRENATKPNAVKASSTAQRRRRTMERSNLENMVAPGDLVVLLCLRKGDAIFAVSADYTKMLSAESNGPWNEDVVVEKAWGSPQHSSATGFLLHVLIRAPERRDGVKTMNRVGTYQTGTSGKDFVVGSPLYFMKLRSLQVTHAVPYGVALGDLLQGSTCRILQVDEAQRAVRAKTKRIELACLQIPKNSPISRQKLQDLPANLGRQLRKVTAGALFTCLVGTAMAARGYSVAREPYLPALPLGRATALRDHPTTATRGRFSNAYLRWKDTTRKWYRRYRGWTDFRRAVFTAAQPETKRPGGGYILGAVGGKIMAYSAAIGLAAVTGIALNAVFGWWARRFDARRAVQARERLLLARQKERSQTLSARKAESESAALIIVYCSGLETELQQHLTTGANETDHVQT